MRDSDCQFETPESQTNCANERLKERLVKLSLVDKKVTREELINRAERQVLLMLQDVSSGILPKVSYLLPSYQFASGNSKLADYEIPKPGERASSHCMTSNYVENLFAGAEPTREPEATSEQNVNTTTVDFSSEKRRTKLTLMTIVLARAHKLMLAGMTQTRRSLYYELQGGKTSELAPAQRNVDESVNHLSSLLECAPWDLGLVATSKGLMAGDLRLALSNGEIINCIVSRGSLIPHNMMDLNFLGTTADFVIIIEKDAVFQRLLEENCPHALNCIMITGKGYPDVATRMLVRLLWEKLGLPIYAVVDAGPFGMEIMCVYRFGSAIRWRESDILACPGVRWLGIHPSELTALGVPLEPLTSVDQAKLKALKDRPYMNDDLLSELNRMKAGKAEIEAVAGFSQIFLTQVYLPHKINAKDYI